MGGGVHVTEASTGRRGPLPRQQPRQVPAWVKGTISGHRKLPRGPSTPVIGLKVLGQDSTDRRLGCMGRRPPAQGRHVCWRVTHRGLWCQRMSDRIPPLRPPSLGLPELGHLTPREQHSRGLGKLQPHTAPPSCPGRLGPVRVMGGICQANWPVSPTT